MGEAALAAASVAGRALARGPLGADVQVNAKIYPPPPRRQCGNNDAAERHHRPVVPPAAAGTTEDHDARPPSRWRVGTPTRLVSLALLAGALALGPQAHAADHGDDLSSATRVALPSEGAGLNFRIRRALDAGTYFVRVVPFGSATGSYTLRLSAEAGSSAATPLGRSQP